MSPILYLGAIGARARLYIDPFVFTACTAKQQTAFLAYKEICAESAPYLSLRAREVDRTRLRQVSERWIIGVENGALQPLTPVHLDDFVRDGVKQQITRARDALCSHLTSFARKEIGEGNSALAAEDLLMIIKLCEATKYSDPYAVTHAGVMQRSALALLPQVAPTLTPSLKLMIRSELKSVRDQQQPLEPMARLVSRLYHDPASKSVNGQELRELDGLLLQPDTADSRSVAFLASLPRPGQHSEVHQSSYLGLLRMCGTSQANWLRHLDSEIANMAESVALVSKNPKRTHVASVSP